MDKAEMIRTLGTVARELGDAGRSPEAAALRAAADQLGTSKRRFLTLERSAERLHLTPQMIESMVERGALDGGTFGSVVLIEETGVERLERLRELLREMDLDGNPTHEEITALYERDRSPRA